MNRAKMKAALRDDKLKVKVMIDNLMLSKREAKYKKLQHDYIKHIIIKVGTRTIFEFYPSGNVSNNPMIKFSVKQKDLKAGDVMDLEWTTLLGYKGHYSKKIKNYVKP